MKTTTGIYNKLIIPDKNQVAAVSESQAEEIYSFLKNKKISLSLETGFGYGCSAVYIISATKSRHIVIDPYQKNTFHNIGLINIKNLQLKRYLHFIEDFSHIALPQLLNQRTKLDFAFIDGGHRFDEIMIDWYFIALMINQKGFIMFDDIWMKSTQLVCSFIQNNHKNFKKVSTKVENTITFQKIGIDQRSWDYFKKF